MAPVKKKKIDDVPQSKTARASMAKGKKKDEGFLAAAPEHMDRIISLSGGTWIYLLNPSSGSTHHLRVGSVKYNNVISTLLASSHAERIKTELIKKGFPLPETVNND
jgi:hypothetical protein